MALGFSTVGGGVVGANSITPTQIAPPPPGSVDVTKIPLGRRAVFSGRIRVINFLGGIRKADF